MEDPALEQHEALCVNVTLDGPEPRASHVSGNPGVPGSAALNPET